MEKGEKTKEKLFFLTFRTLLVFLFRNYGIRTNTENYHICKINIPKLPTVENATKTPQK